MPAEEKPTGGIARSVAANPVFVVTALGLILYGLLRLANSLFYDPLAVKPEEVGLGYAETLSQSAVGVLLVLLTSFAVFGLFVAFLGGFPAAMRKADDWAEKLPVPSPSRPLGRPTRLAAVVLVLLFIAVVAGGPLYVTIRPPHGRLGTVLHVLANVVYGGIAVFVLLLALRGAWQAVRTGRARRLLLPAGAAFALSAALTLATVMLQAWDDGRAVRLGQVRHPTFLGFIPFGSWGADAVWVEWVAADPPQGFVTGRRRCLLYLGRANGTAVFYDAASGSDRTVRVPASDVVITTRNSRHEGDQAC
jgi:hypothetical protein